MSADRRWLGVYSCRMRSALIAVAAICGVLWLGAASAPAGELDRPLAAANAFWDQYLPNPCSRVAVTFDAPSGDAGLALLNESSDVCSIELMPSLARASERDQCIALTHEIGHWRMYRILGFSGHTASGIMTAAVTASTPECDRLGPPAVTRRHRRH